ncbi:6-carboxy-5,6,7,8-tetrahydropterin synthase [Ktedonobacteria bacterium brp13]|nr:6-carboxy-5,6,7,8-tetrahydropterin synthase [Ktedonobacteria bacterium brp13]
MTLSAVLTKTFHFEAAHSLPGHRGKCARLHGHSYRLEVSVRGPIKEAPNTSDDGMVIDFGDLVVAVHTSVIEMLDHQNLNDVLDIRTTAENLAHWIWDALVAGGIPDTLLQSIRLWETETGSVEITHAERQEEEAR